MVEHDSIRAKIRAVLENRLSLSVFTVRIWMVLISWAFLLPQLVKFHQWPFPWESINTILLDSSVVEWLQAFSAHCIRIFSNRWVLYTWNSGSPWILKGKVYSLRIQLLQFYQLKSSVGWGGSVLPDYGTVEHSIFEFLSININWGQDRFSGYNPWAPGRSWFELDS